MSASPSDTCHDLVEAEDRDRALSLAFAPADRRGDLAALYAFNIEIAKVRDQIRQPLPGEIRLQWWRDVIAGGGSEKGAAGGGEAGHPVASRLLQTIERHHLSKAAFDRMLEARAFDLYDDPMPSREHFEAYAGETASTLIMLAATILSPADAGQIADAAGHAGVAQTVAGVLRLLPIHRARGQCYLPADILAAAGCSPEVLNAGEAEPSQRAMAAMVAFGRYHVGEARRHSRRLPKPVRAAFLPAWLASPYLDRIERSGANVLRQSPDLSAPRKVFAYWRAMRG
ncbi:phytoene/squalene synthase family protein [Jiella sp. MQZ9-1]|uniref:Phytoene/squalene synthase family protein n=1 Tax=Jiella flava TaxID=2816857 RepID=A0A939G067_9HYPH|nr:phytoene/squalene synthase family protein [Jiella flava]MBO0663430.1 phytoene/squalene synthase family protein [Jiella flava]MCD2472006.1 phytoene/squalene synthase family protein [Jiella flava]